MQTKICDICGEKVESLNKLKDEYATDKIKEMCKKCENILDTNIRQLNSMLYNMKKSLFKRIIDKLKSNLQT